MLFMLIFVNFGFARFESVNYLDRYDRKRVNYDSFKTGDILLISFENWGKFFVGSFFRIEFLHPVIVVKDGKDMYVVELMGYKNKKGFHKMKLEEWINRNKKNHIMHNPLQTSDQEREELSRKILAFTHRYSDGAEKITKVGGFDGSWWNKYVNPSGKYAHPEIVNGVTPCNEFCTRILVECGVVEGDKPIGHYHPDQFIGMNGFTVNKPFKYGEHYLCDLHGFFMTT